MAPNREEHAVCWMQCVSARPRLERHARQCRHHLERIMTDEQPIQDLIQRWAVACHTATRPPCSLTTRPVSSCSTFRHPARRPRPGRVSRHLARVLRVTGVWGRVRDGVPGHHGRRGLVFAFALLRCGTPADFERTPSTDCDSRSASRRLKTDGLSLNSKSGHSRTISWPITSR